MTKQQAEPVRPRGGGVAEQGLQFPIQAGGRIVAGTEAGQARLDPQIAEQGAVVHPIENAFLPGLKPGCLPCRQHEHVAALPGQVEGATVAVARPRQGTATPQHGEQGGGRHGGDGEAFTGKNAQEVGGEGGTGGWSRATQNVAEIQRQDGRCSLGVKLGAPLVEADRLGEAGAHRVGRFAVVEPESRFFPAFAHPQPVVPSREGVRGGWGRSAAHGLRASETTTGQHLMGEKRRLVLAMLSDR